VIATEATVGSGAYSRAIHAFAPEATVIERACPLFVSLAEEGWAETDVAQMVAAEYLAPLRAARIETLVLGCTHYPILRSVIERTLGAQVELIDSGRAAADRVAVLLESSGIARTTERRTGKPEVRELCDDLDHFYVTDAAERFARVAARFLGCAPRVLEAVEVWGGDRLPAPREVAGGIAEQGL
jgi:glutamate racemase